MPDLILLRHGESQWNLENRFTGWIDVPLTEMGMKEAEEAGKKIRLAGIHIDRRWMLPGLMMMIGSALVSFVPAWGWTTAGALIFIATLVGFIADKSDPTLKTQGA